MPKYLHKHDASHGRVSCFTSKYITHYKRNKKHADLGMSPDIDRCCRARVKDYMFDRANLNQKRATRRACYPVHRAIWRNGWMMSYPQK